MSSPNLKARGSTALPTGNGEEDVLSDAYRVLRGYRAFVARGLKVPRRLIAFGFTLIELLVVMAIIALLLTIAVPRYWHSTDKAKEAVLKEDLAQMRVAIDQYHADRGKYPDRLEDLVERKYLRAIPRDPLTESAGSWIVVAPSEPGSGAVFDVRSGAQGTAIDGRSFGEW
jgi:general secretion pathway protein G